MPKCPTVVLMLITGDSMNFQELNRRGVCPQHSLTALACRRVDMIWDVYMHASLKERGEYKAPCEEFSHQQC